jgi:hypothetical protein
MLSAMEYRVETIQTSDGWIDIFVAKATWNDSFAREMRERGIVRLRLCELEGWRLDSRGLHFLSEVPFLEALHVWSYRQMLDLSPLNHCSRLERLFVGERVSKRSHLCPASLMRLKSLNYGGSGGWVPAHPLKALKNLEIQGLSGITDLDLSDYSSLERIIIKGAGKLTHLALPTAGTVSQVEVHKARQLQTISCLRTQIDLFRLHISKAKTFQSDCLCGLESIQELLLEDMGDLGAIEVYSKPRVLYLSGSRCRIEVIPLKRTESG